MSTPTRWELVERALREADPEEVAEVLGEALRENYGIRDCEMFLVDLRLVVLEPVVHRDAPSIPLAGTAAGRAYRDQAAIVGEHEGRTALHLPLAVRGDRMGVLQLVTDEDLSAEIRAELLDVAEVVAGLVLTAEVVTDRYRRVRRRHRLTLAAEMQWQLLPVRSVETRSFRLAGQLEPAYAVRGDNFDWSQDGRTLSVAVTNGMGESLTASMLTTLAITALRNARRGGADLVDQAALADQAIWSYHVGKQCVSTLLIELDLRTGRLRVVDAGSPRMWRVRGDEIELIELDAQLPLGMLEETEYQAQEFQLEPGDRLFVLTDGVYAAARASRNYDVASLQRTLRASRLLPPAESVRALMSDLRVFLADHDLDDDAVAVCLDWNGTDL